MKAKDFDRKFDDNADISAELRTDQASRVGYAHKRVNGDFPVWMIEGLDREAARLGVTRQSMIKIRLGERLERTSPPSASCSRSFRTRSRFTLKS